MKFLLSMLVVAMLPNAALAEAAATTATPARNIPSVTVEAARIAQVQARVPVSGTLVARQTVQVFPQVSGYDITEILAEAGDTVEKGQVLARLSTDTLSAQLAQAQAEYQRAEAGVGQARSMIDSAQAALTQAQTALERAQTLRRSGSGSQAALDQAVAAEANARAQAASASDGLAVSQAALAQADAARRIATLNLERAAIVAPVAGLIVARNAELGALAGGSADPLFTLIADGAVEMAAEVIETALPSLTVGDPAQISVAGVGAVPGRVRLVPASVDPVTRLGSMRIALDPQPELRTGLFANGWIVITERDGVTVPAGAVLSNAGTDRVQLVIDGQVVTRDVQAGLLWEGRREILDGVSVDDVVIARAGAFFRDGDQVQPVQAPDPDEAQAAR